MTPTMIDGLGTIAGRYGAILCDVWGVVHNGVASFSDACAALEAARGRGIAVILITNAPRPHGGVEVQLSSLGVPDGAYDRVVTSGDVTRDLIADGPRRIFHVGPDRDLSIYDGLDVELVDDFDASAIVCTGLFDDTSESPDDYKEMLARFRARDLPFVCANPDIVVERGDELIWCAGALARDYALLGGRTLISGKPHTPIYQAALAAAGEVLGQNLRLSEVLAIGDGMLTDVKGAVSNGIDVLYISGGIHHRDYGDDPMKPDAGRLGAFLDTYGFEPVGIMARLS